MRNIVLIFGGKSCEHDISVLTALSIYSVIKRFNNILPVYINYSKFYLCKKEVKVTDISNFSKSKFSEIFFSNGYLCYVARKKKIHVDCAINCCHGGSGENGDLAGVFELTNIPYSSSAPYQSALFMDKVLTKRFLAEINAPYIDYCVCINELNLDSCEKLGYPLIIKPARQGSSIGIRLAQNRDELEKAYDFASEFDNKILVEKALVGFTELNCAAVISNGKILVSDVEKIVFNSDFYDFDAKYVENETSRQIPANVDEGIIDKIKLLTEKIYSQANLKGVVRIDFLMSEQGEIYVNEINTVPGSLAFYLFKGHGINISKLIDILVEEGIEANANKNKLVGVFKNEVLAKLNISKLDFGVKK